MTRTILPGLRTGVIRIPASKSQAHRMLILRMHSLHRRLI